MTSGNGPAPQGARILVVEDEYLIADDLATTLEELGYEVVGPVPTVDRALAVVSSEPLDAVLLDTNLAGVSSSPVAIELTARRVPFAVVTGYGNLGLESEILAAAPRVTKPFSRAALAGALAEMLAS